ncbi:MAG: glutamate--tRNA ligase [Chloroflexi bacterium]|nr:glutamate--tRNA ligase [Chloroflexota bacterium]
MTTPVRVRYAPSPTGEPHVGNIRTALFNWLFARHHGGKFILRIEDTDQDRLVPGAQAAILEALEWLGLDWDEGPGVNGPYGPYLQSQRLSMYQRYASSLVEQGAAYYCFCSEERLAKLREWQAQRKVPPGYDRQCRSLTADEVESQRQKGIRTVVRFKTPPQGRTEVDDLIRGHVSWENRLLDDFVILKSDGWPTYHLANVVDDHHMAISHVMRAEEWLPSTPRHLQLYQAIGFEPPLFAHLPMILGPDRSKLSKRHGATSAIEYRGKGYLPEALVNYLALLGWSLDDRTEVISREDLIRHFSTERISKAGAIFNQEKLTWMNGVYIRSLPPEEIARRLVPFLERPAEMGGLPGEVARPIDQGYLKRIVPLIQDRLRTLSDGPELSDFFFVKRPEYEPSLLVQKEMDTQSARKALEMSLQQLDRLGSWDRASLEEVLRRLAAELGLKTGQLFGVLRVALTGRMAAPPLFETMEVLGQVRCMERIRQAALLLAER